MPPMAKKPSRRTILPLFFAFTLSETYIGIVAVKAPTPRPFVFSVWLETCADGRSLEINVPVTTRATMSCAKSKGVAWRMTPMTTTHPARKMVLRRPNLSPIKIHERAPKAHPTSYMATVVPMGEDD
jgi:hypothetical protein